MRVLRWRSLLVLPALLGAATPAQAASPLGTQRTLVLLVRHQDPPCPDAARACPRARDLAPLGPPRHTFAEWQRLLTSEVNRQYGPASFGQTNFAFRVVRNPAAADGWWEAPKTVQQYALNPGGNFSGGIVQDAAEVLLTRAVTAGEITRAQIAAHDRLLVMDNYHRRGGQAAGAAVLRYRSGRSTFATTAAVVAESATDADALSVIRHELGHQLGEPDLYSTPVAGDRDSDGVVGENEFVPSRCPLIEPGGDERLRDGLDADCVGAWDTMGFDTPGRSFSAYTRMLPGWIRPTARYVRTESARDFSGPVSLWPLNRRPQTGRTSVLRLSPYGRLDVQSLRAADGVLAAFGGQQGYTGYLLECRRPEGDDANLRFGGPLLTWVDATRGLDHPVRVMRPAEDLPLEPFAVLGETRPYVNATTGLRIEVDESGQDGACNVRVNYTPPDVPNLAALVPSGPVRALERQDLADAGSKVLFLAGGVRLGTDGKSPRTLEEPRPGRRHVVRLAVRNRGTAKARGGQASLRVTSPYTAAAPCGRDAPAGRLVATTKLGDLGPGRATLADLAWRPRSAGSTGLALDVRATGDAHPGDGRTTSAFAFQTHRPGGGPQRSAIRLVVPRGCPAAVRFGVHATSLPKGWTLRVKGAEMPVAPGRARTVQLVVQAPAGAAGDVVSIPVAVDAAQASSGLGVLEHLGGATTTRVAGGLDVVARVGRGPFRLPAEAVATFPPQRPQRFSTPVLAPAPVFDLPPGPTPLAPSPGPAQPPPPPPPPPAAKPPQVAITAPADRAVVRRGDVTTFRATVDPDLPDTTVAWTLEGETEPFARGRVVTRTFVGVAPGDQVVQALATDASGATSAAKRTVVVVTEGPPQVSITQPKDDAHVAPAPQPDPDTFRPYADVQLRATAADPDPGTAAPTFAWTEVVDGGKAVQRSTQREPLLRLHSPDACKPSVHDLTLTATDADGETASDTVRVTVDAAPC